MAKKLLNGLYAITPDETDTVELLRKVKLALMGGASVLQYRNKLADAELKLKQALVLSQLASEFDCIYLVNDDPQLAAEVNADGVHLGGDDGSVATARALLGGTKIIGVSCYNRVLLAHEAAEQGADYVAFGAFYLSAVKPGAVVADMNLLQTARSQLDLPIVAIGGITQQNGAALIGAGADALAVISALWNSANIQSGAEQFSTLFSRE